MRHSTYLRRSMAPVALFVSLTSLSGCAVPAVAVDRPVVEDGRVLLPVAGGTASIDPATLQIDYHVSDSKSSWSAPSRTELGQPTTPRATKDAVTWSYRGSDLTVTATTTGGRLHVEMVSPTDRTVSWPVTAGADVESVEFPNGEGLSVPLDDPFWLSDGAGLRESSWDFAGALTLPFWGATYADSGVTYIAHSDIATSLEFRENAGRLEAFAEHDFSAGRATSEYEVSFAPTDGTPVAAAHEYRQYLEETDGMVTLEQKIAANPNTEALIGALHAYTWGDGREAGIVDKLQELGIDRAWLGYDADGADMSADTVAAAQDAGYLVGPYDTWDNAQDPAEADTSASIWPGDVWPNGCVIDAAGEPVTGFGGRGCYVSTLALDAAEESHSALSSRVEDFLQNGASSYFLDVDAAGQLFRDYSPEHAQTEAEDRARRLARMANLSAGVYSGGKPLVLGSETAAAWANPVLSYSHGSSTPLMDGIWELQRDKEAWGAWWPEDRPRFFFGETDLPQNLANAMFNPAYRIPLYQAVLHDSVISTDRWEMGLYKFPDLVRQRILTNLLYNTPAVIALDTKVLDKHGEQIANMQEFFGFLQDAAGTAPLTAFEHVEGGVQRTVFGDKVLTVTANFAGSDRADVPAGCVVAMTQTDTRTFCVSE